MNLKEVVLIGHAYVPEDMCRFAVREDVERIVYLCKGPKFSCKSRRDDPNLPLCNSFGLKPEVYMDLINKYRLLNNLLEPGEEFTQSSNTLCEPSPEQTSQENQ